MSTSLREACAPVLKRWRAGLKLTENARCAALTSRVLDERSLDAFDAKVEAARITLLGLTYHVSLSGPETHQVLVDDLVLRGGVAGAARAVFGSIQFELALPRSTYDADGSWAPGSAWVLRPARPALVWVGPRNGDWSLFRELRRHVRAATSKDAAAAAKGAASGRAGSQVEECMLAYVFPFERRWVAKAIDRWVSNTGGSPAWEGFCLIEAANTPAELQRVVRAIYRARPQNALGLACWKRSLLDFAAARGPRAVPTLKRLMPTSPRAAQGPYLRAIAVAQGMKPTGVGR